MDASKHLMSCCYPTDFDSVEKSKPDNAQFRIICINALIYKGKYNKFSILHNKLISLYFSIHHVHLNEGYFPIIIVQNVELKYPYNLYKLAIMWIVPIMHTTTWRAVHLTLLVSGS